MNPGFGTGLALTAGMNTTVTAAMFVLLGAGACSPRGTETGLRDLQDTVLRLSVEIGNDPHPTVPTQEATALLTGQVLVRGELLFSTRGYSSQTGEGCPSLRADASVTIDGAEASLASRGGPVGNGLITTESYSCQMVRFVSAALSPSPDHRLGIAIQDETAHLLMEIDGLFAARAATLVAPTNPPVRIGDEVQVAIPTVPAATGSRATLWQQTDLGRWGGSSVPVRADSEGSLHVLIVPSAGGKLVEGTHVLAVHLEHLAATVATCAGIGTCEGNPMTTAGPFVIELAP